MSGDGFTPRRDREIAEVREACRDTVEASTEAALDFRDLACSVLILGSEDREQLRLTTLALDLAIEAIVDFDVRCGAGDVAGAVDELRRWVGARS